LGQLGAQLLHPPVVHDVGGLGRLRTRPALDLLGLPLPQQGKPVYGVGSNMQGDVVLVALDEVKAGSMPEEQKKAMVQG
ncbi:hypothetical protein, partial [Acinetobacter baumannii]|uniref:hypothetical protein n=1 Tax=Acinetobacter baumannii TaxID=470 RepID=UPI00289F8145